MKNLILFGGISSYKDYIYQLSNEYNILYIDDYSSENIIENLPDNVFFYSGKVYDEAFVDFSLDLMISNLFDNKVDLIFDLSSCEYDIMNQNDYINYIIGLQNIVNMSYKYDSIVFHYYDYSNKDNKYYSALHVFECLYVQTLMCDKIQNKNLNMIK